MSQNPGSSQAAQSTIPPEVPTHSVEETPQHDAPVERVSITSKIKTLNDTERHWSWKAGLRAVICILNIIGIGCVGWLITTATSLDNLNEYTFATNTGWQGGLIAGLCISFIWCFISILIPLLLRPTRPLHPGIAVGIDLILWIGFILLGLLTVLVIYDLSSFGDGGYITDPEAWAYPSNDYNGEYYYVESNNTWVYNVTSVNSDNDSPYYNYTLGEWIYPDPTVNASATVRDCAPDFTSCEEMDRIVNQVWQEKPRRLATSIVLDAVQWLNVLLHFTLFVWACVDTHRYNSRSTRIDEKIVADRIIADLESKGFISVRDGVIQPAQTVQSENGVNTTPHAL